jgi:ankyrin repeat protein
MVVSALYTAVEKGHAEVAELLLNKSNVNKVNGFGSTALYCTMGRYSGIVRLLLDIGADVNTKDDKKQTVLYSAVSKGDLKIVRVLLKRGADVNAKGCFKQTALHITIRGEQELMQLLLHTTGVNVNTRDRNGSTPLYNVAEDGLESIVRTLIKAKQGEIKVSIRDDHG